MKRDRSIRPCNADVDTVTIPQDAMLEAAVLGALLLEPQYVADVRAVLTENAFYNPENAALYGIICRLDDNGDTPDMITVVRHAHAAGIPADTVVGLTQTVGSGVQVFHHAQALADMERRRRMLLYARELASRIQSGCDTDEMLEWARQEVERIADLASRSDEVRSIKEVLAEAIDDLEQRQIVALRGECVGVTTGLSHLDRITGGWRGGQLVVLAGRPAMGKTAVSLHFALAAARVGIPVCYFSLEMPRMQLAGRMLVGASHIDATNFRLGNISSDDWRQIETGADTLRPLPLYLIDRALVSMPQIRTKARAMQHKGRCGMIIIDYLQLIYVPAEERRPVNREREVAEISRAAKLLSKELNIPVLLLAQLSRKVEERADKMPLLSDLRESGAIEQDADMVIFIDRPAVYGIREFDGGKYGMIDARGVGRLTIAKNREGCTGFIPFCHNESLTTICDFGVVHSDSLKSE